MRSPGWADFVGASREVIVPDKAGMDVSLKKRLMPVPRSIRIDDGGDGYEW